MLASAYCASLPQVIRTKRDEIYAFACCLFFLLHAIVIFWLLGRYVKTEEKLSKREWDGSTLGLGRNRLLCYLYDASFRRLCKFYTLRVVWDLILYQVPAVLLFAFGQISFSLFFFVNCAIFISHLLSAPFLIHSWSMKWHLRLRAFQRGADLQISLAVRPILEQVIIA